ncbi:MAG: molybdopterin-binding protein [Treponema sp.]|jgi:hypothetical protein|nr:molybdopterin-binding protein [Treponema sp.]
MKKLRVEDAVGHVLCHDLTRIIKGEMKGPQFRKGHVVEEADIPMLLSMGKEHLYVWELQPGMVHEDDAAGYLAGICRGDNIRQSDPREGKIELFALCDGLFHLDVDRLNRINALDDIIIATRHSPSPVKKDDKLAGMKAVPLVIPEERLRQAQAIAGGTPLMAVLPDRLQSAWVITTGNEVAKGLVKDTFTPVIIEKLGAYGITVKQQLVVEDGIENVAGAIEVAHREKPDLILCTGGMSVDPDDNTPGAIKQSGAALVTYGSPVVPGAMFLLGYFEDGTPIMGIPGCVMYAAATVFDLVLPRIAAGLRMTKQDFTRMGHGGLCLSCEKCHYPICPFGKG